jgi:hypothetical protein
MERCQHLGCSDLAFFVDGFVFQRARVRTRGLVVYQAANTSDFSSLADHGRTDSFDCHLLLPSKHHEKRETSA